MSNPSDSTPTAPSRAEVRALKSRAQKLEPVLKLGKAGISDAFLKSLEQALNDHELVKIRLTEFKEERKTVAPDLATRSGSHLITLIGNVVVLYRCRPPAVIAEPVPVPPSTPVRRSRPG